MNQTHPSVAPAAARRLAALSLAVLGASCSLADLYRGDREYVLYDGSVPPAQGTEARAADPDDPLAGDLDAVPSEASADANLARIFTLEGVADEIRRAIADVAGPRDELQRKLGDVERELAWRRAEAGDAYALARDERIDRLLKLEIVVR
ncbi:MAG: hypothetical protein IPM29_05565 [Planctomycetes bacterium]|nr:hypothetical protein [Planctomycetota bacterium]